MDHLWLVLLVCATASSNPVVSSVRIKMFSVNFLEAPDKQVMLPTADRVRRSPGNSPHKSPDPLAFLDAFGTNSQGSRSPTGLHTPEHITWNSPGNSPRQWPSLKSPGNSPRKSPDPLAFLNAFGTNSKGSRSP